MYAYRGGVATLSFVLWFLTVTRSCQTDLPNASLQYYKGFLDPFWPF